MGEKSILASSSAVILDTIDIPFCILVSDLPGHYVLPHFYGPIDVLWSEAAFQLLVLKVCQLLSVYVLPPLKY